MIDSRRHFIQTLVNSKYWLAYYSLQVLTSAIVLCFIFKDLYDKTDTTAIVFVLEFGLAFMIVFDIAVKYILIGKDVCQSLWFQIDCCLLLLMLVMAFWMGAKHNTVFNEEVEFILMMFRCVLQGSRLVLYIIKSYDSLQVRHSIEDVSVQTTSNRGIQVDNDETIKFDTNMSRRKDSADRHIDNLLI